MSSRLDTLKQLDKAIEQMDTATTVQLLENLQDTQPEIQPEDTKLFTAKIKRIDRENKKMIKPNRTVKIAVAAAAIMVMGVTVYAANAMNIFSFATSDKLTTIKTNESITQEQAEIIASQAQITVPNANDATAPETQDFTFNTIEDAQKQMNLKVILPAKMPEMKLESASGMITKFSDTLENQSLWLDYSDASGRMFGVTTTREISKDGEAVTSILTTDIDEGSLDKYTTKSGVEYIVLTESDETGERTANIATVIVGEYQYALVFVGFEQAEREQIIDSVDISALVVAGK